MRLGSRKGFTLVELIIVIAILGIIALIAVPSLTGVQKNAQINADKRTAEQIGKAVRIWLTDANDMSEMNKREATATTGGTLGSFATGGSETTKLSQYISTEYLPQAKSGMSYHIKLDANGKIQVAIGSEFKTTPIYALNNGTVQEGLAYQEGKSSL